MMNLNPLWSAMSQKQLKYVSNVCTWSCTAPLSFEKNQEQQDILQLYPSWGCCTVENIAVECERRPSNDSPLFLAMTYHLGGRWGGKSACVWQLSRNEASTRSVIFNDLVHGWLSKKEMYCSKHAIHLGRAILEKENR